MKRTPRRHAERQATAEQKQKEENELKCVSDFERVRRIDTMPRRMDTFWRTDTRLSGSKVNGLWMLNHCSYNKGLAFTLNERRVLSIHGLLPVVVRTVDDQVAACSQIIRTFNSPMQRYMYMAFMGRKNRRLFYALLLSNPERYVPYTDVTGSADLLKVHAMMSHGGQGIFITIKDLGHIPQILANWPFRCVRCLLVSNGASVLSLGDMGVDEMPMLFSNIHHNVVFGGIHPDFCLAVMLDVGTNNDQLLEDPAYTGLREPRVSDALYDKFFEEFTLAVIQQYGAHALILCKDFEAQKAKRQLELYRDRQCIVDVDFQCLAAVALAGVIVCDRLKRAFFSANVFLFYGGDAINIGLARLCMAMLRREGINEMRARQRIWFCDADGLIVMARQDIAEELLEFAQRREPINSLVEAIMELKPNVLVGGSSQPNSFTPDVLRAMEQSSSQPVIFALSRPQEQAECTAEAAFAYTKGHCIFISGSKLPPLKYANKWYQPGHCTSTYLVAGISCGVMLAGFTTIPDEAFCVAAERLASLVWPCDLEQRNVYPPMRKMQCISLQMAEAIFTYAFRRGLATLWPQPENPMEFIKASLYDPQYRMNIVDVYCMQNRSIATTESHKYYKLNI
ncbi:LOW QUALITY PROTEIN: NADP-dependent malic enzyme [Drosophila gunungcola]|uniref:LOW QUALITY PROTEIN: NADP-dependent malic enzyme n=1 Tax=Drosophila gunungcola TaxID=103775 RepID=UPI0022E58BD5|nr:LOW QUALITY PROTEIN: NADP-dependent malic enzyme [Drosophila gunungcola]